MEKLKALFVQAVKFGLVGVINTLVDYGVYSLLMLIPFCKEYYVIAQVIGYCAGLGNSLFMNKRWTFSQREAMSKKQLLCFLLVNLAALGISTGVLVLSQEYFALNRYVGKAVSIAFSMGVNFIGNKIFVFKK